MAGRYTGPVRFQEITGANAQAILIEGRRMLGVLMEQLSLGGITIGKLTRQLDDGTVIVAWYDGTLAQVRAYPAAPTPGSLQADFNLWIPSGFVLYPASDTSAFGWGTPVIQNTDNHATPYSAINLAPGLDTARWTPHGRLGETLLTRLPSAGYPDTKQLVSPLLFSNTIGLHPKPTFKVVAPSTPWTAYRIEFTAFAAESPSAGALEQAAIVANKRAFFEAVNTHRTDMGRDPFLLPTRGRSDTAQLTAEVMYAAGVIGHYSQFYPVTFQCSPDRSARDGVWGYVSAVNAASRNKPLDTAELLAANFVTEEDLGADPTGFHMYRVTGGGDISSAQALAVYLAEPDHKAGIEAKYWNGGHASVQYGFKHAFQGMHIFPNTSWLGAGNRFWNSSHAEIPPVTWCGFHSLNLGFETLPVTYNNDPSLIAPPTDPFILRSQLTNNGVFWLSYNYAYDPVFNYATMSGPDFSAEQIPYYQPALDNRIFMRGRCIALAPRGGYVWAAAIQKFDSPDADKFNVYRLVALVHHDADQPSDWKTNGMTRYLRVWYCDLPNDSAVPANPHVTIRGVYGEENEGWPWDQVNSPYSWRGGTLLDVGMPDDSGEVRALKYASQWVFSADGMRAICLRDFGNYEDYGALWVPISFGETAPNETGLVPRALELTFGGNAFNPLTVTKAWRGQNAGHNTTYQTYPVAAGYDANDHAIFCMTIEIRPSPATIYAYFGDYDVVPTGPMGTQLYVESGEGFVPGLVVSPFYTVLDVRDQVVSTYGFRAPDDPDNNPCFLNQSSPTILRVAIWRGGTLVDASWYSNPDQVIPFLFLLCQVNGFGSQIQATMCDMVVPSYASNGTDWVVSYVVQPQVQNVFTPAPGHVSFTCGDPDGCIPVVTEIITNSPGTFRPASRGGWMTSSFANTAALAAMTNTPGVHPRSLYARVV